MQPHTDIGGEQREFPPTRRSLVAGIAAADPGQRRAALGELIAAYWKPSYAYLRLRWRRTSEDAKDLTQAFFAAVVEKGFLSDFDPAQARLRTYLRACLDRFVAKDERSRSARKRGGEVEHVPLDFAAAERDLERREPADPASAEAWFEAEWRRALVAAALADLQRECDQRGVPERFAIFRRYDVSGDARPTYAELAGELGLETHAVTNALSAARRDFRRLVLERLRAWTRDEREFQEELRALFGSGEKP